MAIQYDCPHGVHEKRGVREYYICDINHKLCQFTRFCNTEHRVVFTKQCVNCKVRNND